MEIKEIIEKDLHSVIQVHKNSFNGFFLTELGDRFLYIYYNSIRINPKAILLGLYENGKLCGFCAATLYSKGFNKKMILNNLIPFFKISIRLLFTKPYSLIRLIKNFSKSDPKIIDKGEYAELLSIGVSVDKQSQGIGKQLLIELEKELKSKGCTELSLTTDYYNNVKTIEFYKRLGYSVFYDFIAYPNRKMYRMIKNINLLV